MGLFKKIKKAQENRYKTELEEEFGSIAEVVEKVTTLKQAQSLERKQDDTMDKEHEYEDTKRGEKYGRKCDWYDFIFQALEKKDLWWLYEDDDTGKCKAFMIKESADKWIEKHPDKKDMVFGMNYTNDPEDYE